MVAAPPDGRLEEIHRLLLERFGAPEPRDPWDPLSQFIYSLLSSRTKTDTTYAVVAKLRERFGDHAFFIGAHGFDSGGEIAMRLFEMTKAAIGD